MLETSKDTAGNPLLEGLRLNYRVLGLNRNPFESIPVFSESQSVPDNYYLRRHVRRLYSLVNNIVFRRSACIYLVGPSGCGKSAILRSLCLTRNKRGMVFPLYTRFPLAGGRMAFLNDLLRRLPVSLLRGIFSYVQNNISERQSYIGWKLFSASSYRDLWKSRDSIKISPQYAIESIADLFSIILKITDTKRIALALDEFEHAWARFTGPQKYNWEKTMADLFKLLKSRVILILPALPDSVKLGSRPYMNMYDWERIDLDKILGATNANTLNVECSELSLKKCIYSIMHREILDVRGERLCDILLRGVGRYHTIGEAILDLHDQILKMARGPRN